WNNAIGGNSNELIYMLAWESLDERGSKFDTFLKDPERVRVFAESEKNGPIVQQVANTILRPTGFSPMKRGCARVCRETTTQRGDRHGSAARGTFVLAVADPGAIRLQRRARAHA